VVNRGKNPEVLCPLKIRKYELVENDPSCLKVAWSNERLFLAECSEVAKEGIDSIFGSVH
jgi:hypothetical protein